MSNKTPIEHPDFDPTNVPLKGINLIEASAGTGKTYSIAILALRLIVEEGLSIGEILMVTFTRDATAEMKLRVRDFLRQGLQAAKLIIKEDENYQGLDKKIVDIILDAYKKQKNIKAIHKNLEQALLQFDQAAIFTIHSFCARILGEYAFETDQIFHSQPMEPAEFDQLVQEAFDQGWREHVTTLDEEVLSILLMNEFSKKRVFDLVSGSLKGKKLYIGDIDTGRGLDFYRDFLVQNIISFTEPVPQDFILERTTIESLKDTIFASLQQHEEEWTEKANLVKNEKNRNTLLEMLGKDEREDFISAIKEKMHTQYVNKFFPDDLIKQINDLIELEADLSKREAEDKKNVEALKKLHTNKVAQLISILAKMIYDDVVSRIQSIKSDFGQITFDDMISGLHRAVCNQDPTTKAQSNRLIKILRDRYKAVFIDEFQDTDQLQFDIFNTVFNKVNAAATPPEDESKSSSDRKHIVFFIGDPKQSIYAFRKADLETYLHASTLVDHIWRMNTNFRSTPEYVEAMNEFFQPTESDFDVFSHDRIKYYPVNAAPNSRKGGVYFDNQVLNPLRILCSGDANAVIKDTVLLVHKLLCDPFFKIKSNGNPERIQAGQIGILVRKKNDGQNIRNQLSRLGIPAVTVSDTKVFETQEALEMLYILTAVHEIQMSSINRALLTKVVGLSWNELNELHEESILLRFRSYQEKWINNGVFAMLRQLISDSKVIDRRYDGRLDNAERVLANTFQLMEMLHEAEVEKKYKPDELIFWLKKGIDGEQSSEDSYLQRIESDEASVKIVTMHSCKGLEYDIVIAPYLDLKSTDGFSTKQFRQDDGYYIADEDLISGTPFYTDYEERKEQENMRLLYVAITRARYHSYVVASHHLKGSRNYQTSLKKFITAILDQQKLFKGIRFIGADNSKDEIKKTELFVANPPELSGGLFKYASADGEGMSSVQIPSISISDRYWRKTSYTKLNVKREPGIRLLSDANQSSYDEFIFKTMRKGAQTGIFLHDLLERIDFSSSEDWAKKIADIRKRYPGTGVELQHLDWMIELLRNITETSLLPHGFSLNTVGVDQRLNELEFDIPLTNVDWKDFPISIHHNEIPIRINKDMPLSGILNGKIDLLFEHEGRYYLLDWKSNHLGNRAEDYNEATMAEAMEENNFHLQYYLYSLALYRYLLLRLGDEFNYEQHVGGVYYLFVRGMRKGTAHGIYFHKPKEEDLKKLETIMLRLVGDTDITQ